MICLIRARLPGKYGKIISEKAGAEGQRGQGFK